MSSRTKRPSPRAQRFWDRLVSWYGTRLTDQYGKDPAGDWCDVVDDHDNPTVALVLAEIKSKHPQYPPSYPEVDALFVRLRKPPGADAGPTVPERLCDYVLRHYAGRLTRTQLHAPWTYIGRQPSTALSIMAPRML